MGGKKDESEDEVEDEVEDENEDEVEDENEDENESEKVKVKKVKTATLKVARVENTEWLQNKFGEMQSQIDELKTQLTAFQAEKLKTKKRRRLLTRKQR